jgi:hypothetical protein
MPDLGIRGLAQNPGDFGVTTEQDGAGREDGRAPDWRI